MNEVENVIRKAHADRDKFATQAEYDAHVDSLARDRQRKPKGKGRGAGKTRRSPIVRRYAINRAERETLNGNRIHVCESTGEPFEYGLHVHHVRTDAECKRLGILWDSRQNVLAITPDEHARAHWSREELESLYPVMDAINEAAS